MGVALALMDNLGQRLIGHDRKQAKKIERVVNRHGHIHEQHLQSRLGRPYSWQVKNSNVGTATNSCHRVEKSGYSHPWISLSCVRFVKLLYSISEERTEHGIFLLLPKISRSGYWLPNTRCQRNAVSPLCPSYHSTPERNRLA